MPGRVTRSSCAAPTAPASPSRATRSPPPAPTCRREIAAPLARLWPPALLARPLADALLHADLRPDDRVLVSGGAWPWLAALLNGSTLILGPPEGLLPAAAEERATVLIAPAAALAQAAFRRPGRRPDLAALRSIVATGGPLSPEGRARIYTWIKPGVMLLARSGDTLWGNPLEPILARPAATPGLFRPPQQVRRYSECGLGLRVKLRQRHPWRQVHQRQPRAAADLEHARVR